MRTHSLLPPRLAASLLVVFLAEAPALGQPPPTPAPAPPPSSAPAPPAQAPAPSLSESLTGQAKDDYDTGRILVASSDFAGAVVKFRHAYDLSSDVRLLWNVAVCEKNLRHYVQVLKLLDRYLHDGDPRIPDADRAAAATVLRTVRSLVGSVRVIVNEPGAAVTVDDAPAGTTPLAEPLMLDLGDRRIRVSKPGFKDQTLVQNVAGASEATVSVALERVEQQGRLALSTDASATIRVDGATVGVGRWEGVVTPGTHAVEVTESGMRPYSAQILVRDGESRSVEVALQRESGGISPLWWVGGGVVAAAALGVGGYFLFRSSPSTPGPTAGTIEPYTLTVTQSWR